MGLSPRTRRNLRRIRHRLHETGSISAHAEEPVDHDKAGRIDEVYLRARGGTSRGGSGVRKTKGLSPRTRRNPRAIFARKAWVGSISAHAEEPLCIAGSLTRYGVYLRARGGTRMAGSISRSCRGLSPRTRRNRADHGC
ncbi:Hypothetical protein GbCGDNIH5_8160 [Granulibacter bethesdensis]|nr:Hypothetical protein GbCGDNIH5_8160 [Granulibacter bethesdensis]